MDFPVTIAPEAIAQLRRVLARKGRSGAFFRIGVKGGGCSGLEYVVRLETVERDTDLVFEAEGLRIVLDPKSAKFLSGATLAYTGELLGGGFKFQNPNAVRSCGCGTSFTPAS
jgi:iron-sulfur cluster assembly protein